MTLSDEYALFMSYNPVAAENAAAIKAEALAYSALYAKQGAKHVQYSWILWVAIAATVIVLTGWRLAKRLKLTKPAAAKIARTLNRTTLFGFDIRISRLQLILISFYTLYNIIFTFADIPYGRSYRYTSKHAPGFVQLATTIQFIANRTGFLAFASTPLVFLLVSRYNIITLLTGVSYQHLNLLHRCAGWMVFALSWIHTLLWTIEMGVNYHNEEGYLATRWQKRYWLGGFFATLFLSFITLHSLAFVRRYTGYEFFRITHNLGSVLFLIGCWVHWPVTFQWLAAALALYYSDRFMRWGRLAFHYARARGRTLLHGQAFHDEDGVSVASVEITNSGLISWTAGQHVYLYCISLSEWEPHPFSVANCGRSGEALNLIIRGKEGMTSELLNRLYENKDPIKVLVDGPYGSLDSNLLDGRPLLIAVAGTGISFGLSVLHTLARSPRESPQQIRLVWYIRRNGKSSFELGVL